MARCARCGFDDRTGGASCPRCGTPRAAERLSDLATSSGARAGSGYVSGGVTATWAPEAAGAHAGPVIRGHLTSVLPNGQDDQVFWLESDQVDLGRSEGDIRIEDPQLGPRHARLNLTMGGAMLTPLDRRNGVYLRLRSVVELADGDHLLLGRQVLRFEILPEHERRPRPAIEDGVVLFGTPAVSSWGRLRQLTSSGLGRDLYHLSRASIVLGREQADLVFADDEFLSRRHAEVSIHNGKPLLQDLGSSNGTFLRLRAPQVLVPGDMIRLGDQLLRFELG